MGLKWLISILWAFKGAHRPLGLKQVHFKKKIALTIDQSKKKNNKKIRPLKCLEVECEILCL